MFRCWILTCIQSPSYSLAVNGGVHGYFKGGKGLRQGDPISPLIFVLVIEYFSRLMLQAVSQQRFNFHPGCKSLKLCHLSFADDMMIFCRADKKSIHCIKNVLEDFAQSTGLSVNEAKSQIILGGVSNDIKQELIQVSGFGEGQLPLTPWSFH